MADIDPLEGNRILVNAAEYDQLKRHCAALTAEVNRGREELDRKHALWEQTRAENARLREAAARLEMAKRWFYDKCPYFLRRNCDALDDIFRGTTPIPPDLKGEPK